MIEKAQTKVLVMRWNVYEGWCRVRGDGTGRVNLVEASAVTAVDIHVAAESLG